MNCPDNCNGYFTFVLHAHLPYLLGQGLGFHESDWFNEAVAQTYIPLLNVLNKLIEEGISPKITIGITPVLAEQLTTEEFREGFLIYLQNKTDEAMANQKEFREFDKSQLDRLSQFWQEYYVQRQVDFIENYKKDIIGEFRRLQNEGHIELITSCATYGYLPLLSQETSITAQIKQGILTYKRLFGEQPKGFWLPECAYRPVQGIEKFLSKAGIDYFIIDAHLLKGGKAIGNYAARFEILKKLCPPEEHLREEIEKLPYDVYLINDKMAVFTRDPKSCSQIFSYSEDGCYLDCYKKHFPGGLRYWQKTSSTDDKISKLEYETDKIEDRIKENASLFKDIIKTTLVDYYNQHKKPGIVVSAFNAEFFGHCWFEGPKWLYYTLKEINADHELKPITCAQYLQYAPPSVNVDIREGSWGEGGNHWLWLNESTEWTWKYIYESEKIMQELATKFADAQDGIIQTILKQLGRQLFLLQASDWQFLITTWLRKDYAEHRVIRHYEAFKELTKILMKYSQKEHIKLGELNFFDFIKKGDGLFPDISPNWWAKD